MIWGPVCDSTSAMVDIGTMDPSLLRTNRRTMSLGWLRKSPSAWAMTRQVRPNLLKSLI